MNAAVVRVLLTEDEPVFADLIRTMLADSNPDSIEVDWAPDLKTCLAALADRKYDVLLLDLHLPDSLGLDTVSTARKHYPGLPIVAMTGQVSETLTQDALKAGAQDFFEKNELSGKLLARVIRYAIDRRALELELERRAQGLEARVKERTRQLQYAKDQWEKTFDAVPDFIAILDSNHQIVRANRALAKAVGAAPEALKGRYCFEIMHGGDGPIKACPHSKTLQDQQEHVAEIYLPRLDLEILVSTSPLIDENGQLLGSVHVARDVSHIKQAQQATAESERRHRMFMDRLPDPTVVYDTQGKVVYSNAAFEQVFGWSRDELLNKKIDFVPPEALAETQKNIKQVMLGEPIVDFETERLTKDGRKLNVRINSAPLFDAEKNQTGNIIIIRDITAIRGAEAAQKASEQIFRDLVETMNEGLTIVDSQGRILYANPRFCQMLGLGSEAIEGQPYTIFLDERNRAVFAEQCKKCKIGEASSYELVFTKRDGGKVFTIVSPQGMTGEEGELVGAFSVVTDISEQKKLESQLIQAQKLESIGQLAAGIAHEINTPIQYVGDNTRFLKDAFEDMTRVLKRYRQLKEAVAAGGSTSGPMREVEEAIVEADLDYLREEIPKAIDQSLEGVGRVASIVRAMKDFSHPGAEGKTQIDINKAIESTVTVARNEWKYAADLELDLDSSLPLIPVLPGEFNQVILNMIINSAHAIGDAAGEGPRRKGVISISTRLKNEEVEIRITDTGGGIPEEIRGRVFDPFFTTKEVGKGTGQGLAIAHSVIVDKHAGSLRLDTEEDRGTTFSILLPIADDG